MDMDTKTATRPTNSPRIATKAYRRKSLLIILCGGVISVLLARPATASTVLAMSLPEIVRSSQLIAKGSVLRREVRWNHGDIVTECTIAIEEMILGPARKPATVTVRLKGGEYAGVGLKVVGEPRCPKTGTELVLAAHKTTSKKSNASASYHPVGMSQGWFPVRKERGGKTYVMPPAANLRLVSPPTRDGRLLPAYGPLITKEPLRNFLDRLKHLAHPPKSR